MRRTTVRFGVGLLVLATFAPPGRADFITINFDSFTHVDAGIQSFGPVVSLDGFTFTATHPVPNQPSAFVTLGTLNLAYPGKTSLYYHIGGGQITLTATNGGPFDLASIDLIELPNGDANGNPLDLGPFSVTFTGNKEDGGTVVQTFAITQFFTFKTLKFDGFTDLSSVVWFQGPGGGNGNQTHQFTNVVVQAVPAPAGIVLAGVAALGLIGIGWRARARAKPHREASS
jgi:hypothetical protein